MYQPQIVHSRIIESRTLKVVELLVTYPVTEQASAGPNTDSL